MSTNEPIDLSASRGPLPAYWVGPRHLAGDDGLLADVVAGTLTGLGWTNLTLVRGRQETAEADEERQVVRSTVLHLSPDALAWAQWMLADEPFLLGELPVAWQVCARAGRGRTAEWSACFTPGVPGEALVDFLLALDARAEPAEQCVGPETVLEAFSAHGWLRDIDQPQAAATDPAFTSCFTLCEVPSLIQDGDPHALAQGADGLGPVGWQGWAEPAVGDPYLWCASFSASVPHDLVAAFAASLSSPAPVLRRVLPECTQDRLVLSPVR
ncbi:DUF317 domain-containing protein [Streptomyces albus]|uniref:DUF317 domain-containing protein n=1 Tax=Streptomyces albus TaxID=1888 RepID=UPI003F1A7985